MPKQSRNSTRHSGVFFVELDSGDQTFSFATRKTENSLKREPEGKTRDGQQQKLIVSKLQKVGGM